VGVIRGLWHLPLWLVSGYQGTDLLLYSLFEGFLREYEAEGLA
jgi:hypothetical protein